ncbi:type IX secretion system membrane protein PorP/SprF [Flavobacterium sp. NRK1]|jgi:type IX secretion system PorP/SprF family membrane protein|uniref:PorP/SprF family type IX secretion system membrane protein n=1 Tax=Flavobacterium sp. NRK1 TaxID=2954929 RepID=UPI0020921B51|nr:type IX secretion system membrane protein PorP/SprF [Flavobacterium sp. NRK1]MCO6147854.1 type IX secretion system membrane protein PorP/SprF [Flavobacterium sp. NRK1]
MKKIYTLLVLVLAFPYLNAQELNIPTFTQYLADNPFVISPAYAGIGDHVKIRANGLTQWVGIKDAPDNQSLAADMRISANSGIGVFLYNDKNGYTRQYGGRLSYAHHIILDPYYDQYLSFGISYNLNQFKIDTEDIQTPDQSITNNRYTVNHNFDVALLYRFEDFYASFTAGNILNKNIDLFATNEPKRLRNYQLYTGYVFKSGDALEIEPSAYVQYFESDGRSSTDFNMKFRFLDGENYYWAGINYRFLNDQFGDPLNIGPMVGLKVSNFYFAYSYQITTNELLATNSGTHMVTLGIDIFQGVSDCPCTHGAH